MMRVRAWFALGLILCGMFGFSRVLAADSPVVIVPIHGTVDDGMAHLVERAVADANSNGARAVVLDVNSPGGLVASAFRIRDAVFSSKVPVLAYVSERAYSAAALISLSAGTIVMGPGASIGAAEPIPGTPKTISALRAEFESTAIRNHRDATIAGAMVDKNVDVPAFKRTGSILTLNTNDALRAKIADATASDFDAFMKSRKLEKAPRVSADYTWGEEVARFATSPEISGLLLTLGMLGLLLEMQTMHGIAGTIGVGALALFFGTHVYAGFSNGLVVGLAILGLLGILWELHVVPGHGAPGILGGIALLSAVLLAFGLPFFFIAIETISTSIILTVILFALAARVFPENAWMKKLVLVAAQGPEYVTSSDFTSLRGAIGTASSFLRPAGVALIDDRRVDVLTEGEFIAAGTPVRVTRVEGARVFVEPVNLPSYK
ncbi:MAG: ATP-dependent Clp protease proteolytic subunit [Candidatus Eremiobacteraeota bacterium]|nr:ATP-dependent Clp protease proteolytic subunit [Candidatus Eremiobacteraeota bacterium]